MKEIPRREFITKALIGLGSIGISGCLGKETPTPTLSRDKLFQRVITEKGIRPSESERNLWKTDLPLLKWSPRNYENQLRIAEVRLNQLINIKMMLSQNQHFRKTAEFLHENKSKIKFTLSRPGEKGGETTRVFPILTQDGKIFYEIELALPGWRSNVSAEGGLRDIDLAFQLVHEVAHIKYYQNLEKKGSEQGLSGDELLEFVRRPNREYRACVDSEAFAYGESMLSYLSVIGLAGMRKEDSLLDDLAEIFIQNNFDVGSRAWREAVVEKTISCQHTE